LIYSISQQTHDLQGASQWQAQQFLELRSSELLGNAAMPVNATDATTPEFSFNIENPKLCSTQKRIVKTGRTRNEMHIL